MSYKVRGHNQRYSLQLSGGYLGTVLGVLRLVSSDTIGHQWDACCSAALGLRLPVLIMLVDQVIGSGEEWGPPYILPRLHLCLLGGIHATG